MKKQSHKSYLFLALLFLLCSSGVSFTWAANPMALKAVKGKEKTSPDTAPAVESLAHLDGDQVNAVLAKLSDDQVRRLLLEELQRKAKLDAAGLKDQQELGGLAGFINRVKVNIAFIRERIKFLQSGAGAAPQDLPRAFRDLSEGKGIPHLFGIMARVAMVFAIALFFDWLFNRYIARARRHIASTPPDKWRGKMGRLALNALIDFVSLCVFIVSFLIVILILSEERSPQRLIAVAYLAAYLMVRFVNLISKFLLSPYTPELQYLPVRGDRALYFYKWTMRIAVVGSFGWLTCGVIKLQQIGEASHLLMVALVGFIICLMIVWIILQNRESVAETLRKDLPAFQLRTKIAGIWHKLAILYVLVFWAAWVVTLLLVGSSAVLPAIATLLSVPVFFLLNWALGSLLNMTIGIALTPDQKTDTPDDASAEDQDAADQQPTGVFGGRLDFNRLNLVLRRGLKIMIAAAVFFWLMELWGIDVHIGRAVVRAAFSVLIAVLLSYVIYELINARIEIRLRQEMPDDEEEKEEGGAGGSRIGTLLLLFRKFMLSVLVTMGTLIVLSAVGVDIGPLIAGAGVIGLAIGFGAQTLVKDIISGIFFLVDDAFRVGDYVNTGSVKGMVEHISLRSLRLRNPRGMVHTIPFGAIGLVTNFSRDYIIMKLDIRLRYDTDVDKVRKIIKKIDKEILKNEELAPKLLGKIKSQGIRQMDDSAMIVRIKFKTIPGEQFAIRKEVFLRVQELFKENDIEFAHRNVTVYIPPEPESSQQPQESGEAGTTSASSETKKKILEAGAAAALTAALADEAKDPKAGKK